MRNLLIIIVSGTLFSLTSFAKKPSLDLEIEAHDGLYIVAKASYLTEDCRSLRLDESLNPEFGASRISVEYRSIDGKNIKVPNTLEECNSKLMSISLYAYSMVAGPGNVVDILHFDNENEEQQSIKCEQILHGPQGRQSEVIYCFGNVSTNSEGKAKVKFSLKK